jgi:hypothetical protein
VATPTLDLEFQGLGVRVTCDWPEVMELLRLDYGWFERPLPNGSRPVSVEIRRQPPSFERYASAEPAFVTPRNTVYRLDGLSIIDYWGRALGIFDRGRGTVAFEGESPGLVHEAAYMFVLSRAGEHLDANGLPRMHGLGLAGPEGATLVILPSGGGKTTLALKAVQDDEVRLLSEDSPLLDRRGRAHPFPLRIGVNASEADSLPPGVPTQRVDRMELHPKFLVPMHPFDERIQRDPVPVANIVIGQRSLGRGGALTALPRRAALEPLLRECVIGVGIYQGMEFILQRGMRDVVGQTGVGVTRAVACLAALRRARVWRMDAGRDADANWRALKALVGGRR